MSICFRLLAGALSTAIFLAPFVVLGCMEREDERRLSQEEIEAIERAFVEEVESEEEEGEQYFILPYQYFDEFPIAKET